jgi:pyruvate formate lyase activating enzyme
MADFLVSVDPLMPWHITAFHPDYKMAAARATRGNDLLAAADIGVKAGMKYIYLGNLTDRLEGWEDTRCHQCAATLIRRRGFHVHEVRITSEGACPDCGAAIPGIWR